MHNFMWLGGKVGAGEHFESVDGLHEMSEMLIHKLLIALELRNAIPYFSDIVACSCLLLMILQTSR